MPTSDAFAPSDLSPPTVASTASRSARLKTRRSTSESASGSRGNRSQRTSDASTSKSAIVKRLGDCRRLFSSTASPRRSGTQPPSRRRHPAGRQKRGEDDYHEVSVTRPLLPPRHSNDKAGLQVPIDNQIEAEVDRQGDPLQEGEDLELAPKLEHHCFPSNSKVPTYLLNTAVGSKHPR